PLAIRVVFDLSEETLEPPGVVDERSRPPASLAMGHPVRLQVESVIRFRCDHRRRIRGDAGHYHPAYSSVFCGDTSGARHTTFRGPERRISTPSSPPWVP